MYSYVKNIVDKALAFEEREDLPVLNDFYEEKTEEIPQYIKEKVEYERENQIFSKNIEEKVIFEEKPQYNSYKDEIKATDKQKLPGVTIVNEYKMEVKVEEEVTEIKNELNYRIIGQLNNMYILVERENELEIYDQHIVHERILYEELKEQHLNKKISVQNLLVPIKIEVSLKERDLIENNLEILKEYGFELDEFGEKEYLIRTAPIFDFRESVKETFYYILDKVEVEDYSDFREKILISMSCKNAIKAHEPLNNKEIKILLDKLHYYGKYTCPHGRPIIIKLPFDKLDKMFGRK